MKLKDMWRQYAIWVALLFTLAMAGYFWWQDRQGPYADDTDLLVVRENRDDSAIHVERAALIRMDKVKNRQLHESQADIFDVLNLAKDTSPPPNNPSPPVIPVAMPVVSQPVLPPPVPTAPPLPFSYVGKLIEDGKPVVFLSARGRNAVVKTGDTIDHIYHVDEIGPAMMTLTYLPMKIQQTLNLGTPN